jgi:hypothetical protein
VVDKVAWGQKVFSRWLVTNMLALPHGRMTPYIGNILIAAKGIDKYASVFAIIRFQIWFGSFIAFITPV